MTDRVVDRLLLRFEWGPRFRGTPCMVFTGPLTANGYGRVYVDREKSGQVHRLMYEHWVGPIPEGLTLDHLCRNRACMNPIHAEPVTHAENVRRGNSGKFNSRKTHCPQGHEYTPENTRVYEPVDPVPANKYTRRICKACVRICSAKRREQAT